MELRKEIELVLDSLKVLGLERGQIEQELDYSENYIDQVLSKGGNRRFLIQLKKLKNRVLQNPIPPAGDTVLPHGNVNVTLQDYIDLLKQQKEQAEREKAEYLSIIKENLTTLAANSGKTLNELALVVRILRSDDSVLMDSNDRLEGRPPGTLATEAGNLEIAAAKFEKGIGKKTSQRK